MDATHFRRRAANAREMAQSGDDVRLSRMLLEVALELDAEAEAMEAGSATDRRGYLRIRGPALDGAVLQLAGSETDARPVQIVNLSVGGASFHVDYPEASGRKVILELPAHNLRLAGTILRISGTEAAMVFEPASRADPALGRFLRSQTVPDRIRA